MNSNDNSLVKRIFPFLETERSRDFEYWIDIAGRWAAPILILVVLILASIIAPHFYEPSNLRTILLQASVLGVVTVGQTLVLLTRSIDMSVGAVMGLGAVIVVQTSAERSMIIPLTQAFLIAAAIGVANGLFITKRNVPPFVTTFGMLVFVEGARLAYTKGQASGTVPALLRSISVGRVGFLPAAVIVLILINLIFYIVLNYTRYGRWVYAVGGNPDAAHYSGVQVDWVLISAHILCSTLALIGGLLLSGYVGYVDLGLGVNYNMNSIAASVVGGTTFSGGHGNLLGAFTGAALFIILLNLVVVLGLSIHWQYVMQGLVLVLATALQGFRQYVLSR